MALTRFVLDENRDENGHLDLQQEMDPLDLSFCKMIDEFDFMSLVMYPDLKNRREFVHECWKIANAMENEELMTLVCSDPYYFLTREDILLLLQKKNNKMINIILQLGCKHSVNSDIGYKLISIKNQ